MQKIKVEEILKSTKGKIIFGDKTKMITKFSTDTRTIQKGDFFIPLIGENFDGHDYINIAIKKGASGYITSKSTDNTSKGIIIIKVKDTNKAFLNMSAVYKKNFKIPFIAITGSVGKTTTKDMIADVLSEKYNTLFTKGNFNNEIGVPKTLFNLSNENEIALIEMGMNNFGEISRLSKTVKPETAIITNIGLSHIGNFKSINDILIAKLEVLGGMSRKGKILLCGDDSLLFGLKGLLKQKTIFYGIDEGMDYRAVRIVSNNKNRTEFDVDIGGKEYTFELNVLGIHNVKNALAAIAIGDMYQVEPEKIIKALKKYKSTGMRMVFEDLNGIMVINDTYNASPDSMKAALDVLRDMETAENRIAVLGDMLELGDYSGDSHYEIGGYVVLSKVDKLITYGAFSEYMVNGAIEKGMAIENIFSYNDMDELIIKLRELAKKDDCVLVKGSRGRKMEMIIKTLWGESK